MHLHQLQVAASTAHVRPLAPLISAPPAAGSRSRRSPARSIAASGVANTALLPLAQFLTNTGSLHSSVSNSSHQHQHHHQQQQQQRSLTTARAGFGGFGGKSKGGSSSGGKNKDCPCGSGKLYLECCQVYHKSAAAHPDTPERLVKARYSAFLKKNPKYLRATSHPDNPALAGSKVTLEDGTEKQCSFEEDFAMTILALQFVGMDIVGSSGGGSGDGSYTVDARVRFRRVIDSQGKRVSNPPEEVWLERASLVKDDEGHWLVRDVQPLKQ